MRQCGQGVLEHEPSGAAAREISSLYKFAMKQVGMSS
jgi:hypothetical protein